MPMTPRHPNACELLNKVIRPATRSLAVTVGLCLVVAVAAGAQPPDQKPVPNKEGAAQAPVAAEAAKDAQDHKAAGSEQPVEGHEAQAHGDEGEHGSSLAALIWPTINFAILVGLLWYFLKTPIATYLQDRHTSIRRELVEAANVKATATAQLAEIDRKLQALPGEIEALRTRGAEEIVAEERRIAGLAAAERERLLEQTRREIDLQLRLAKRELVEHTADLAVTLAGDRIQQQITPADQQRLVDRYLDQVKRPALSERRESQGPH
jgi:F-type H+-transporting ATPase subunit b